MKSALKTALYAAAAMIATTANAATILTLSFIQPTGTAASNAPIDVFVRLTADPASDPLTTDGSGRPTSGYDFSSYAGPIDLDDPATSVVLNNFFECSGDFTIGCNDPGSAYDFTFNYNQPSMIAPLNFDLQPGQSLDYLFGTFTPNGGNAPAGTYRFFNTGLIIQFYNPGATDSPNDDLFDSFTLAETCTGQDPDCAFERQVSAVSGAVPEPATWAMMISGFGIMGAAMRRHRRSIAKAA